MPKQPDDEARKSKQLIDGWLGTKVSSFCYPYYISHGYLADAVQNAGYEQAREALGLLTTSFPMMILWIDST
jgi:hypothetical protein